MFRRADILPIGLDIGHDSVKMLQLELCGGELIARAAASRPLDPLLRAKGEAAMDAALEVAADLLRRGGFIGRRVVAALPREIVHIKNLRLPLMPAAELPTAIRFEARNIFPFDTESAYVDYLAVSEVRQGGDVRQEVIVLAARQAEVDDFLERLDRVGMIVDSLDADPCALYRTVEKFVRRRDDDLEVHVLIDVGLRRTQVVIGRGRELTFVKPIDIGGQRLNEIVAQRLGITMAEAQSLRRRLSAMPQEGGVDGQESVRQAVFNATRAIMEELGREVSLCLRYHSVTFRGPGPTRVRVLGGEANDPNLRTVLGAALSMPVEVGRPLISVNCSECKAANQPGPMCEWATALGLVLKKTGGKFPPRDGSRRSTRAAVGEVIDLNQAVASAGESRASDNKATAEVARA